MILLIQEYCLNKEIIKMISKNNYKIDIEIELSNGKKINYKNT